MIGELDTHRRHCFFGIGFVCTGRCGGWVSEGGEVEACREPLGQDGGRVGGWEGVMVGG